MYFNALNSGIRQHVIRQIQYQYVWDLLLKIPINFDKPQLLADAEVSTIAIIGHIPRSKKRNFTNFYKFFSAFFPSARAMVTFSAGDKKKRRRTAANITSIHTFRLNLFGEERDFFLSLFVYRYFFKDGKVLFTGLSFYQNFACALLHTINSYAVRNLAVTNNADWRLLLALYFFAGPFMIPGLNDISPVDSRLTLFLEIYLSLFKMYKRSAVQVQKGKR